MCGRGGNSFVMREEVRKEREGGVETSCEGGRKPENEATGGLMLYSACTSFE